jgi:hypothetical protein
MQEKIGSWSLVVTKSRDQENYPSRLLVTTLIMLISVVYTNFLLKAITSYAK